MKCRIFFPVIFLVLLSNISFAQSNTSYEMIGKKIDDVIKVYGKPAHQDNSNPLMKCIFYKTAAQQLIFVADQNNVYQIESTEWYNSKTTARDSFEKFISGCIAKGFTKDSINVDNYELSRPGTKIDLSFFGSPSQNKYQIIVKSNRSEN